MARQEQHNSEIPAFAQTGLLKSLIWVENNRLPTFRSTVHDNSLGLVYAGALMGFPPLWIAGTIGWGASFAIPEREKRSTPGEASAQSIVDYTNYLSRYVNEDISKGYLNHFKDDIQLMLGLDEGEFGVFTTVFQAEMLKLNEAYLVNLCKTAKVKPKFLDPYATFLTQTMPQMNRVQSSSLQHSALYELHNLSKFRELTSAAGILASSFFPVVGEHINQNFFDLELAYPGNFAFTRRAMRDGQAKQRQLITSENQQILQDVFREQTEATHQALQTIANTKHL